MSSHPRLSRSVFSLNLVLLLTTFLSAGLAQGADRKVLLENFTREG